MISDQPTQESDPHATQWAGLPARLAQVLSLAGITQTDLARQLGISPGFVSEVVRGLKRPGPDFFMAIRRLWGVSIDWLASGEGSMTGGAGIRQELLRVIKLQIAVAKAAIIDADPLAKALLVLIREGQLTGVHDEAFAELLERISPADTELDLAVELYNGHLWTVDPIAQRRNLLAAAVAHFETRRPLNKLAALTGSGEQDFSSGHIQFNMGHGQRIAGRDYNELRKKPPRGKKS
jgi:transcriptional regulator with XRE-family HTH domain